MSEAEELFPGRYNSENVKADTFADMFFPKKKAKKKEPETRSKNKDIEHLFVQHPKKEVFSLDLKVCK